MTVFEGNGCKIIYIYIYMLYILSYEKYTYCFISYVSNSVLEMTILENGILTYEDESSLYGEQNILIVLFSLSQEYLTIVYNKTIGNKTTV